MAFSFHGYDLLGIDDLAFFTGDGVNQDITFTVDNLIPIRDAITGPITLTWKVSGPDTYVAVNLSYIYGDTIPVDVNGLNIGAIQVLRDGNTVDLTTILIPSNTIAGSPSAVAGFAKTFLLQDNDLLTISVVEPTGGGNGQNTVTGVLRAVEVSTPQTPDFDYLALDGAGSGNVLVKNDGSSWAIRSQLPASLAMANANLARKWQDVVYGNGRLVAINSTDRMVLTSLDLGHTWIPSYFPLGFSVANVHSILYGNGLFVVASYDGTAIAYSPDGINWEMFFNQNNPFLAVSFGCYAQGKFVWASQSGHLVILDDALSAVQFVLVSPDNLTGIGWVNIKYGDGKFVLIENGVFSSAFGGGVNGSMAGISTDLFSWSYTYLPSYSGWYGLTYNKSYNHFYASSYGLQYIARFVPDTSLTWEVDGTVSSCPSILVSNGKSTMANANFDQVFLSSEKPANLNNPLASSWINQTYPMSPGFILAMTAISSSSGGGGNNGPYTLDITTDGNGTITLSNPGPYYYGDVVLVSATPNSGYLFNAWTGGLTGSVNPYSLTVTQNVTAVATFQAPSGNAVGLVRNLHSVEVDSEQLLDVPIEVTVVDSSQNPVSVEVDIRAEIYSGNGILLGTKTLTSQAGVAVFSDLAIQGAGYVTLLFTSPGLNPILSAAILVNNVGTNSQSLRIDTQPSGAVSGSPLTQQPTISTVDINDNIIVGSVNVITVSVLSGNAVLSGTTSLTATDGYVAFTDLVLTGPSGPVVLQFTSPGITTATSLVFNLVNNGNNLPLSGNFPIRPKSSITANKAPTTSDLVAYELAVNLADQKIYMRDGANKVYLVGDVSSGSSTPLLDSLGNVTITNKTTHDLLEWNGTSWVNLSPSGLLGSGTKNFLARWDGNGKLETSGVLDSGTHITSANASIGRWASNTYTQFAHSDLFSPTASTNYALLQSNTGVTFLNSTGALHFRQSNAEVAAFNQGNLLIGYADGDTTTYKVDIKGTLHATGDTTLDKLAGTGSRMVLADASGTLSTDAIPEGTVTSVALSSDSKELTITGSPVTDSGTIDLALSATGVTAGSYTHASVTVDASGRITSASSGDTASLKAGTGISISGTYPEFTITNEAPDQTVTLTAGSGIGVTGTYPSFTVSSSITQYTDSDARKALSAGTGISYNSTTGVISNNSPDQTVVLSAGTGISTSGTYPSFTITNNAPDQVVKLTAGSGISTSGTYPDFTISSTLTQYTDTMARSALSAGTGISYNSTTGVISNASPDQTVVLTAGSGITTSGTYPNFTITSTITQYTDSDARKSLSAGTGISYNSSTGTITNSSPDQTVTLTAGTGISVTGTYPSFTITNSSTSSGGTVTSVDLSVPTGFKVSGNPVTTSGKLAVTFDTGYALPTTASQTTWDTAYSNRITSLTTTGSSGSATLSANTLNIPTYTLAGLGGIKLTDLSSTATGLTYSSGTGVFSFTSGYSIPTTSSQTQWDTAYSNRISSLTTTGSSGSATLLSNTLNIPTYTLAGLGGIKLTDLSSTATGLTYTNTTGVFSFTSGYSIPTTASQSNWDVAYSNRITSLTTTGSSGSATLSSNTLNIPTYTLAGLGGQASSTNLTSLSGLTYAAASFVKMTGAGTFALDTTTYLTTNQTITLSGDVTGSGTTAITATLATVAATKGGTGQTTYTLGDTLYSSAANTLAKLAGNTTTTKQFLSQTGTGIVSAAPAWSTVSKSDVGLGSVENTALSTWAGSSNVTTLGTISQGTWNSSTKIGLAYGGTNASITATNGGVIYSTASALAVTAAGTSGQILKSNGAAAPTWMSTSSITSVGTLTGLAVTETVTTDDTVVITGVTSQTGKLLLIKDALANTLFSVDYSGSATTVGLTVNGMTYPGTDGSSGQVLSTNGAGTLSWASVGTSSGTSGTFQIADGAGGFNAALGLSYQTTANVDTGAYSTGAAQTPLAVFGYSTQSGNLFELRDYTGATTYAYFDSTGNLTLNAQNDIRFADSDSSNYVAVQAPATIATNYTLTLPTTAGTNNYVLKTNGSGTLSWANAIANLIGGNSTTLLGSIPYQSNTDTTTLLSPNTTTTRKFLRQTGTGTNGSAPAWDTLTAADVPTSAANSIFLANNFGGL